MTIRKLVEKLVYSIKDKPITENNLLFLKESIEKGIMSLTCCLECSVELHYNKENDELSIDKITIGNLEL